jgi:hypothetical protein
LVIKKFIPVEMDFYGRQAQATAGMASKGILLLVVIPAVLAFAFAAAVLVSMLPEIDERLYDYYGYPDAIRVRVGG